MGFRLIWKFVLVYVAIAVVTFVLVTLAGGRLIEDSIIENYSMDFYNEADSIADYHFSDGDSPITEEMFNNLKATASYQNLTILITNSKGRVMADTRLDYDELGKETIEGFDASKLDRNYYSIGSFFDTFDEDMLTVIVPISGSYKVSGYVSLHMPLTVIRDLRENILRSFYLFTFIVLFITFIILVLIILWVTRPLNAIIKASKEYSAGNLGYKIRLKSNDEIGYLARTLNVMAGDLKNATENQHKFIANVSHDFRSPLTTIKGYIEAIKDGTIPKEDQDKYLDIVLSETERLTKLTSELLELDKLDFKKIGLDISVFDINLTIKEVAASFEGRCTEKNISFSLLLEGDEFPVSADRSKIQQVLYNLIDNAIKFSPQSSKIEIETTEKHDKAYVSIKDHGIGIPYNELNNIWKRFYKVDSSRGRDRMGTGLGLAIVREIIQDHGQKINVISTEKAGTEFVFTLDIPDKKTS